LYIAGLITDANVNANSLFTGDTERIVLDGLADGPARPGVDDRDLYVSADGRLREYGDELPGAYTSNIQIAVTPNAGSWQFEMGITKTALGVPDLWNGRQIGATFCDYDNDGALNTWNIILCTIKKSLRMQ